MYVERGEHAYCISTYKNRKWEKGERVKARKELNDARLLTSSREIEKGNSGTALPPLPTWAYTDTYGWK